MARVDDATGLRVELKNQRPVELLDLTLSLHALGRQDQEFVHSRGFDPKAKNVRLYIRELKSGSIIADLQQIADQASFVLQHAETYAAFVANFNDLVSFFLESRALKDGGVSKREAERVSQFLEPVAKDGGSQLFLTVQGDAAVHVHLNSEQANAIQNNVRRFIGPQPEPSGHFQGEALYLYQLRGDASSRAGDRGVIEAFSSKPVKLHLMSDDVKAAIIDAQTNPFHMVYVVDGQVSTVNGEPALYKIYAVHDAFDRP